MQIGFKNHKCKGFGELYGYSFKHAYMITKEAKQRLKILNFWKEYGLRAITGAYGAKGQPSANGGRYTMNQDRR